MGTVNLSNLYLLLFSDIDPGKCHWQSIGLQDMTKKMGLCFSYISALQRIRECSYTSGGNDWYKQLVD